MIRRLSCLALATALSSPLSAQSMSSDPEDAAVAPRHGKWEISVTGGAMMIDRGLRDFLMSGQRGQGFYNTEGASAVGRGAASVVATTGRTASATTRVFAPERDKPSLVVPMTELRIGYAIDDHFHVSLSAAQATGGGVTNLMIGPAVTWTTTFAHGTSPFVLAGSGYQRITGANGTSVQADWGANVGLGMRQAITARTGLRIEGRLRVGAFSDIPARGGITYSPVLLIGLSHFAG